MLCSCHFMFVAPHFRMCLPEKAIDKRLTISNWRRLFRHLLQFGVDFCAPAFRWMHR